MSPKRPCYRFDSQLLSCTHAVAHKHTCTTTQPISQSSSAFRPGVSQPKAGALGWWLCLCPCVHHGCTVDHFDALNQHLFINYSNTQSHLLIRAVPPCCQGCVTEPDNCDLSVLIVSLGLHPPSAFHSKYTHSLPHTLISRSIQHWCPKQSTRPDASNWTLCFHRLQITARSRRLWWRSSVAHCKKSSPWLIRYASGTLLLDWGAPCMFSDSIFKS